MKKVTLSLLSIAASVMMASAQAPTAFNYQGIARNGAGAPLASKPLGMRITIHDGSPSGPIVFQETQTPTTNPYGLYNVAIGNGTPVTGSLGSVNFAAGQKYVQVEIDANGGTAYADLGASQLLSVPYALNAASAPLTLTGNTLSAGANTITLPSASISGTTNYHPKFTSASSLGNSGLYETTNSRIGFGTTTPTGKLHVAASASTDSIIIYAESGYAGAASGFGIIHAENTSTSTATTAAPVGLLGAAVGSTTVPVGAGVYGVGSQFGLRGQGQCNTTSTAGVYGIYGAGYSQGDAIGVFGGASSYSTSVAGTKYGIYGLASTGGSVNYAGYFAGNVAVTGLVSKGGGTFKIDHPLDPENKYLYHSFVESPDMMNIYNGNITTDAQGFATVTMPAYFDALNKDFRYQLTVMGTFAQAIVKDKMSGNSFRIQTSQPNVEVSWQVTGIRQDAFANAHRVVPEVAKEAENKGKYLHPAELGQPITKEINYEINHSMRPNVDEKAAPNVFKR